MVTWSVKDMPAAMAFLAISNKAHPAISVMMEEAKSSKLPFIRIKLIKLGKQLKTWSLLRTMLNHALTVSHQHQIYLQKNVIKRENFLKLKHPEKLIHWFHGPIARSKVGWRCMMKIQIIIVWFWKENKQLPVPSLCGGQTTINKSAMPCLRIQMWSVWCGLCWLYTPTPFSIHWWTQALCYWKTSACHPQSEEQRTIYHP